MPVFFSNSGRFARSTSSLKPASIESVIVLPCAQAVPPATRRRGDGERQDEGEPRPAPRLLPRPR